MLSPTTNNLFKYALVFLHKFCNYGTKCPFQVMPLQLSRGPVFVGKRLKMVARVMILSVKRQVACDRELPCLREQETLLTLVVPL